MSPGQTFNCHAFLKYDITCEPPCQSGTIWLQPNYSGEVNPGPLSRRIVAFTRPWALSSIDDLSSA